jgi:hypothetical protein
MQQRLDHCVIREVNLRNPEATLRKTYIRFVVQPHLSVKDWYELNSDGSIVIAEKYRQEVEC